MAIIKQVIATAIASSTLLCSGLLLNWPAATINLFSSTNTTLSRPMSGTEISLLESISLIGSFIGTPFAGYLIDTIGRKYSTALVPLIQVICWVLVTFFKSVEVLLFSVTLSGLCSSVYLILPVFISEICQESIRGTMTATTLSFDSLGYLLGFVLNKYLKYMTVIYIGLGLSLINLLLVMTLRESPVFLMKKGLIEDAEKSIAFYRSIELDSKEVSKEMDSLRRAFDSDCGEKDMSGKIITENKQKRSLWKIINTYSYYTELSLGQKTKLPYKLVKNDDDIELGKSRSTHRALIICLLLQILALCQGMVLVQIYTEQLFKRTVSSISATTCSIVLAAVGLVASLVASYLTDCMGRRPLLVYSSAIASIFCIALGTQIQFKWGPEWLTVVFVYLFSVPYYFGAGTVPLVFVAEVFIPEVKALMTIIVFEWLWLCEFIIAFVFNPLIAAMGLGPVFYMFAISCILTAVFGFYCMPETNGIPVDQIQMRLFKK